MPWVYFVLGVLLAGPLAALATYVLAWRSVTRARRLAERARNRAHLVDIARLTGGLAHEIKNPLSTVKLNLKLLEEEFQSSADDLHRRSLNRLRRVADEVQRVHDILEDFLKYAGEPELHPAPADLRKVVDELIDFYRPQAERCRVVLRAALPQAPISCCVDAGLIKQAVLNLMINATQAMTEGGELLLRLEAAGGRATLEVIDTGAGIPPEVLGKIFDAYFTTRPGGSGLGLPMTRRIVRLHDGDIRVHSELGKGTRFVVSLPLAGKG